MREDLMKKAFLIAATAAAMSGCAMPAYTPPPQIQRPEFPEAEYAALPKNGTATVTGQAFLKTRGGTVKTGAGNKIFLEPATSYTTFEHDHRYSNGYLTPTDPRSRQYIRDTIADASGHFTFKNIPNGSYYLSGQVTWEAPTGYKFAMERQGGWIYKTITVKNGESLEVMLTE
jgi:hypothetical protein